MKILLIDDDVFLRDMYAKKFTDSGFDVTTSESSSKTISLLSDGNKYDIGLFDMIMPGTNGVELLTLINERFPNQIKYSIFLTNQGQDEDIREATEAGAIGYIVKASTIPSEVVVKIREIIANQK